tara:strand:+ start:502 stop:1176 length:675 start_codon:yes stop_codon:yes gene_type:complete
MESNEYQKNDLDYNDGLGELLNKKVSMEFSWSKTILVISSLVIFILIGTHLIFNLGKSVYTEDSKIVNLGEVPSIEKISELVKDDNKTKKIEHNEFKKQYDKKEKIQQVSQQYVSTDTQFINNLYSKKSNLKTIKKNSTKTLSYKLIIGTYRSKKNALNALKIYKNKGIDSFIRISYRDAKGNDKSNKIKLYQIQAGAFDNKQDAINYNKKLKQKNLKGYILKI